MHVLDFVPAGWAAAAGDSFLRQNDAWDAGVITSEHRSCVAPRRIGSCEACFACPPGNIQDTNLRPDQTLAEAPMTSVSIRNARPDDAESARAVHTAAFGNHAEADLVDRLIADGQAAISLVAAAC